MSYSGQTSSSSGNTSSSNSASQYAAAALGMGLVALGVVMVVWSVVPAGSAGNSSRPGAGSGTPTSRSTSTAAFVMLGIGVAMLILALCLGLRNKRRSARQPQANGGTTTDQNRAEQSQSEQAEHYAVPSYEEVVGNEQYPISQFTSRKDSTTRLPAYEELMERPQGEVDGSNPAAAQPAQTQSAADDSNPAPTQPAGTGRRSGRAGLKLLPLKVRRIKSEKLGRKTSSTSPPAGMSNIEPLTPPPQYDDAPPELPHAPE